MTEPKQSSPTTLLVGSAQAAYVYSRNRKVPIPQPVIVVNSMRALLRHLRHGPVRVVWLHDRHHIKDYVAIAAHVAALGPVSEEYEPGS